MQEQYNVIASNIDYHKHFVETVSIGGATNEEQNN